MTDREALVDQYLRSRYGATAIEAPGPIGDHQRWLVSRPGWVCAPLKGAVEALLRLEDWTSDLRLSNSIEESAKRAALLGRVVFCTCSCGATDRHLGVGAARPPTAKRDAMKSGVSAARVWRCQGGSVP